MPSNQRRSSRVRTGIAVGLAITFCTSGTAAAAPVADLSRTTVAFGKIGAGRITQAVYVTNSGDAPLAITALALTGAAADFALGGTCVTPITLTIGGRCRIEFISRLTTLGARTATLTLATNASPPSPNVVVSAINVGVDLGIEAKPAWLDFGAQPVGSTSAVQTLTMDNPEIESLTLESVALVGGNAANFTLASLCAIGGAYVDGRSCASTVAFAPLVAGPLATELQFDFHDTKSPTDKQVFRYSITGVGGGTGGAPQTTAVAEYYNSVLDHYFITWVAAEQANLDAGRTPTKWNRTGFGFNTFAAPQAGSSPVCRFYIPPDKGDSHFFGRGTAECNATGQKNPTFVLEDPDFMNLVLPTGGVCPAGTLNVYRVFSNRPDANHRYMTDRSVRDAMVAKGWIAEGDGPDLVVMCAPQ